MKMPKFTTAKVCAADKCATNERVKQKNYTIVLLIALSFTLITSLRAFGRKAHAFRLGI